MISSAPAHDALDLAEHLRPLLHRLLRQLRRESPNSGVSPLQALLLADLSREPGIGVGDLARLENLRGPTISGHIKAMELSGLLERSAPMAADRRRTGLNITAKGRAALDAIKQGRTDWLAQKLAELSPQARAALRAALDPLAEMER